MKREKKRRDKKEEDTTGKRILEKEKRTCKTMRGPQKKRRGGLLG